MSKDITTKFKVDISDLKKNISAANQQIKQAEAEFRNATVGMDNWAKSADGLSAAIDAQTKKVSAEEDKLAALKQEMQRYNEKAVQGEAVIADLTRKHQEAADAFGEDSAEAKKYARELAEAQSAQERNAAAADRLRTDIVNQDTAVKNAKNQLDNYRSQLHEVENQTETLTDRVSRQESELRDLKAQYANVAAEQGDTSAEARQLATQITNLSGELRDNRTRLDEAEQAADQFDRSLEDVDNSANDTTSGGLSAFGVALGNLAANIISSLISKMKDLVTETLEVGKTFDSSMSQVGAVSGASAADMELLRDKAKEMGATTKFTASEAADAFNFMAMAGWKTEDMLNGIDGILQLAAASGSDLATTSDIVTDALTAMGYSAADAGHLADVMAAASSNANTNVEMMGQTFKYAAPVAGALGYSMEDTAVAIGLMANAGIKADQAGTSLRSVMTRLSAPPKECANAMNELGISLTDSEGNMKTLDEVMQDLRAAFDGLNETEQTAYAKHIAGANAMSGLLAIVNAAPEDFDKLTNAVANSEGAAQEMSETMLNNLGGDMTLMRSNLESLQLAIYEKFEPALREGVKALNKLIDVFKWIVKNGKPIAAAITGVATAVGTFMVIINKQAIITAFTTGLTAIKTAFMGLWTVLSANPIGLIIAAITGLVAAFTVLWNTSDEFRNFWIGLWENIKEVSALIFEAIKHYFTDLWETAQPLVEILREKITAAIAEVQEMFAAAWGAIMAIWDFAQPYFAAIWEAIQIIFSVVPMWFKDTFNSAWENIKKIWSAATGFFKKIWTSIKTTFSAAPQTLKATFANAWDGVKAVWSVATGYFKGIWDGIKTTFSVAKDTFSGFFTGAWNAVTAVFDKASGYFKDVWTNIKKPFSTVSSFFSEKFSSAWGNVVSAFSSVKTFFVGKKDAIVEAFKNIPSALKETFSGAWDKVKSVFSLDNVRNHFNAIKDAIKGVFDAMVDVIKSPINTVIDGINSLFDTLNSVSITIPHVFDDGETTYGFSLPHINRLAKGGIIDKATIAEIGEAGREAVIPLENNKAGLREIARMLREEMPDKPATEGYTFNQTINSPKPLSRYELYRQTKNLIRAAKLGAI